MAGCALAAGGVFAGVRTDMAAAALVPEGLWAARNGSIPGLGGVGNRSCKVGPIPLNRTMPWQ